MLFMEMGITSAFYGDENNKCFLMEMGITSVFLWRWE